MKKLFTALVVCLLICTSVLTACGSPEENFKKATQKFDNFTVETQIESAGEKNSMLIIKADKIIKFTAYTKQACTTTYIKSENDKFYLYDFSNKKWGTDGLSADDLGIGNSTKNEVIGVLTQSFFDDYTVSNGEYVLKDSALSAYSEYFSGTLTSFRVTLKGDCFEKAIAIEQTGTERIQYTYTFSNFGSSKIDIK